MAKISEARIEEIIKKLDGELSEKEKEQDHALKLSREIVRECSKMIKKIHQDEKITEDEIRQTDDKMKEISKIENFKEIKGIAMQEYAELQCLKAIIEKKQLPYPEDIHCNYLSYAQGLADCVGELRRQIQISLKNSNKKKAEELFREMESIYENVAVIKYSSSLTGMLRKKQDVIRIQLEQARSELLD
jgi:translin